MGVFDWVFPYRQIDAKLDRLLSLAQEILKKEVKIMAQLDEVLAGVEEENTQIASLAILTANIKKALDDALSGVILPPEAQAKVDAIFAGIQAGKQAVINAINANTPQE